MSAIWHTPPDLPDTGDMVGYDVEAVDGGIGSIDEASWHTDRAHLVVDTGPWIFGRRVLVPAGTVSSIDHESRTVHVELTKDAVKASPEYDPDRRALDEPEFWDAYDAHYRAHGGGGLIV